jgi:hypothetical protein
LVEQLAFNQWVDGSSPSRLINEINGLARTLRYYPPYTDALTDALKVVRQFFLGGLFQMSKWQRFNFTTEIASLPSDVAFWPRQKLPLEDCWGAWTVVTDHLGMTYFPDGI